MFGLIFGLIAVIFKFGFDIIMWVLKFLHAKFKFIGNIIKDEIKYTKDKKKFSNFRKRQLKLNDEIY